MAEITMPQLGETVTEGTITRWAKQVGESIAEDEVLFEVSTDKVDSEVPSPVSGVVTEILVPEGETVDVGTRLAVISAGDGAAASAPAAEDASAPAAEAAEAPEAPATEAAAASAEAQAAPAEPAAPAKSPPSQPAGSPAAGQPSGSPAAGQPSGSPAAGQPSAPAAAGSANGAPVAPPETGKPAPEPDQPSPAADEAAGGQPGPARVLSPVVRRLIAEHDLDPSSIPGTGAGGRITRSDVLAVIDSRNGRGGGPAPSRPSSGTGSPASGAPAAPAAAGPAPGAGGAAPVVAFAPATAGEHDEVVPFTNIRRRTAEHMVRSKHTSAHTMVAVEVDYSGVEKVRAAAKAHFKEAEGFSLTYLPFITRAVVDALEDFPHVNSSVGEDSLIVHHDVNIGIAVDLDFEGLLVPVIHEADGKRLRQLAREISGLAAKARSKRLTMDDISGGTFTITNAGPFGTFITVPVINQPQVAILSTDGVRKRPVVVELPDGTDGIAIHPVGNLVMSWDHRAFDGAYAAAFLKAIKDIIETRDWSSEL